MELAAGKKAPISANEGKSVPLLSSFPSVETRTKREEGHAAVHLRNDSGERREREEDLIDRTLGDMRHFFPPKQGGCIS